MTDLTRPLASASDGRRGRKRSSSAPRRVVHLVLILGVLLMVLPFVWEVLTTFKTVTESRQVPPVVLPSALDLSAYGRFFSTVQLTPLLAVSVAVLVMRVVGQLVVSALAAYGFARFAFRGRELLFGLFLLMLMAPSQLFLIAQFNLVKDLGLLNTLPAIALPGVFSAFGTFLLRQAFLAVPMEYEEAAELDGANAFQTFWRIALPLTAPTMAALVVLTSLYSWNDLLWPLIVVSSDASRTLPLGLAQLQGQYGTDYPALMAGSLIASLPLIAIFIALQRQFFDGIASSGLKG
jgi:multiple sugar transport system permease protein